MFSRIHHFIRPSFIAYSLLGGCLTLISITPIQAKTPVNSQTVAQFSEPPGRYEYDWNSQFSENSESYLVIVDNTDFGLLQQVQVVERDAFAGRFQGRSVIQAGVFNDLNNAQQRTINLRSLGISSRIYSRTSGREIANSYNENNSTYIGSSVSDRRDNNKTKKTKYYYVAIPGKSDKLFQIENQIRQSAGGNSVGVAVRNSPRGPHVAVGPFGGRFQAEQWNYYLRSLGLNNARVYYGK